MVTVNGTNVPVCALKKSLVQRIAKSEFGPPAIAASARLSSASPSLRCASSRRTWDRAIEVVFCWDEASAPATAHANNSAATAARRSDRARRLTLLAPCCRFQRMGLNYQRDHRRPLPPSQR